MANIIKSQLGRVRGINIIKLYIIKLDSKQLVFEVLAILRESNVDALPVYEGHRFIGDISKEELVDFLNHLDNGKNIYFHKLNFDLGTALIKIREQKNKPKKISSIFIRVAVIIFIVLGLAWPFFSNMHYLQPISLQNQTNTTTVKKVILPGSNKATLTFVNGKTINLSEAKTGLIINASDLRYNDNSVVISKEERELLNNSLPHSRDEVQGSEKIAVTTPRGGEYQVTLSDGTRVWLNAASSLKFPSSFAGAKQRKVELTGEAYFEVAENKAHPFIVVSNDQLVKVLGTHFNISNYDDENSIKTTLSEGSLRVESVGQGHKPHLDRAIILKPGQQSIFTAKKSIEVKSVDASDAIAWKDGKFAFRNESLENIMRKVSRWYDVEIVYQNNQIGKEILGGSFTRTEEISTILAALELAGDVHFKIQGRKVIVTK